MTPRVRAVCHAAIGYFDGDVKRVQHFLKVLQFSTLIAEEEALPPEQLEILQNGQYAYQQKWTLRSAIEAAENEEALSNLEIAFVGLDFSKEAATL